MSVRLEVRVNMAKRLDEIQMAFQVENAQKNIEEQKGRNWLSIISDVIFGIAIVLLIIVAIMYYRKTELATGLENHPLAVSLVFLVMMMISLFLKILSQKMKSK